MLLLSAAIKITKSHLRQEVSTDLFWQDVDYRYKTVVQMSSTSLEFSAQNRTWPVPVRLETIKPFKIWTVCSNNVFAIQIKQTDIQKKCCQYLLYICLYFCLFNTVFISHMKPFILLHRRFADDSDINFHLQIWNSNVKFKFRYTQLPSDFRVLMKIQGIDLRQRVTPKCMQYTTSGMG